MGRVILGGKEVIVSMDKEEVLELVRQLPDEVDVEEVIYRLYLRKACRSRGRHRCRAYVLARGGARAGAHVAEVRWTQRARDDLRDIHDFIARDSPRAAEALIERLLTAAERLAAFYPRVVALCQNSPRLAIGKSSSAVTVWYYQLADNTVWITAVVHGRRLLRGEPDNA